MAAPAAPVQESSLSRAHPDHPVLSPLEMSPSSPSALAGPNADADIPHPVSQTPVQMTSPESSQSPDLASVKRALQATQADSLNARSKSVSVADGDDTYGVLNRHPALKAAIAEQVEKTLRGSFRVGVSEDRNKRCRRSMEDAHSFIYDFAGVKGQGYFAVFDGHAGKHAAEWCGQNFHEYLLDALLTYPDQPVPDVLNKTYHSVDSRLSHLAYASKQHSGCTAVTVFLRVENDLEGDGPCGFTNSQLSPRGLIEGRGAEELEGQTSRRSSFAGGAGGVTGGAATPQTENMSLRRKMSGRRIREFVRGFTSRGDDNNDSALDDNDDDRLEAIEPKSERGIRRVLYTANVGDARAVLCRGGKAVRLTYDHKGSDSQEAKRITDAGGFVMNSRVNGVLAVTRSLGDASMKEFVVGSPYTTETRLDDDDEFLIVACDGLWDVCEDQDAVDLIRDLSDPQEASKKLLDHALANFSTDNLSVMVIKF